MLLQKLLLRSGVQTEVEALCLCALFLPKTDSHRYSLVIREQANLGAKNDALIFLREVKEKKLHRNKFKIHFVLLSCFHIFTGTHFILQPDV